MYQHEAEHEQAAATAHEGIPNGRDDERWIETWPRPGPGPWPEGARMHGHALTVGVESAVCTHFSSRAGGADICARECHCELSMSWTCWEVLGM